VTFYIQSPDGAGQIDGTLNHNLLRFFPNQVSRSQAEVVIVPISMFHNYTFNGELNSIHQPIVIVDFIEYEWCWDEPDTHVLGRNTKSCRWLNKPSWHQLDDWAASRNITMYFKRELLKKDVTDRIKPIEWACYLPGGHLHSRDEFNRRPLEVYNVWGYSNPSRAEMHADIFRGINTNGLAVVSEFDMYDRYFASGAHTRTWMSVFSPHFMRRNIFDLMRFQEAAKLTVSLPGAGQKCFRSTEAPVSSIMAMQEDNRAWSFDWTHGHNCIRLPKGGEFAALEAATHRDDLFDIYMRSLDTIDRYRGQRYVNDYLLPLIQTSL
jgi:hypothetical protein